MAFLDHVQADGGARYGYTTPGMGSATTAIGLLGRMQLGWKKDNPALERGVAWLAEQGPAKSNVYYNYYATEVMWHWQGPEWEKWNGKMRELLVGSQADQGHEEGSWFFGGHLAGDSRGGRLYHTAMSALILEAPNRHPAIFRKRPEPEFPLD
jgi:hypothetical protein